MQGRAHHSGAYQLSRRLNAPASFLPPHVPSVNLKREARLVYSRFTGYYARYVEAHTKDIDALDRELVNINAALNIASEHHLSADLVRIANNFAHFLDARGLFARAENYLQQAKDAANVLKNKAEQAAIFLNLGTVMVRQGNYTQAESYFQEGLVLARETNQRTQLIGLLQSFGMLAHRQGKLQRAEALLQEGLALARADGDKTCVSLLLKNLGTFEAQQGNYEQAEIYWREGLVLARQCGDREAECLLLLNLGQLASEQGEAGLTILETIGMSLPGTVRRWLRTLGNTE